MKLIGCLQPRRKAFTMVELIMVMVVMAVIASWGIPQYTKTINRARARNTMNNLRVIHAANVLRRVHTQANLTCTGSGNACTIAEINNINGTDTLNIVDTASYTCNGTTCVGTIPGVFSSTLTLGSPLVPGNTGNPTCTTGVNACP